MVKRVDVEYFISNMTHKPIVIRFWVKVWCPTHLHGCSCLMWMVLQSQLMTQHIGKGKEKSHPKWVTVYLPFIISFFFFLSQSYLISFTSTFNKQRLIKKKEKGMSMCKNWII